jgi:hypothetical protein
MAAIFYATHRRGGRGRITISGVRLDCRFVGDSLSWNKIAAVAAIKGEGATE